MNLTFICSYFVEFVIDGLTVTEPEIGGPKFVNISVVRTGGSVGVVTVEWNATLNGEIKKTVDELKINAFKH